MAPLRYIEAVTADTDVNNVITFTFSPAPLNTVYTGTVFVVGSPSSSSWRARAGAVEWGTAVGPQAIAVQVWENETLVVTGPGPGTYTAQFVGMAQPALEVTPSSPFPAPPGRSPGTPGSPGTLPTDWLAVNPNTIQLLNSDGAFFIDPLTGAEIDLDPSAGDPDIAVSSPNGNQSIAAFANDKRVNLRTFDGVTNRNDFSVVTSQDVAIVQSMWLRAKDGTYLFRLQDAGGAPMVGFFDLVAGQQTVTGSQGGNAALGSLLTALAAYGLIVDNTTP